MPVELAMSSFTRIISDLERCALTGGDVEAFARGAALPDDLGRALVRSRRLRVLDWLAQSGLSVVNVMRSATPVFLALAGERPINDKHAVAEVLWRRLEVEASERDPSGWLVETGRYEVMLVEARRTRTQPPAPREGIALRLVAEARIAAIDPRAQAVHVALPDHDVPTENAAAILEAALAAQTSDRPCAVPVMAFGGIGDAPGTVAELDEDVARVLAGLAVAPRSLAELRRSLGPRLDVVLENHLLVSAEGA